MAVIVPTYAGRSGFQGEMYAFSTVSYGGSRSHG